MFFVIFLKQRFPSLNHTHPIINARCVNVGISKTNKKQQPNKQRW